MGEIKINTDLVRTVALDVSTCSRNVANKYQNVESKMNDLNYSWCGRAAELSNAYYQKLKSGLCEKLNVQLNYFSSVLNDVVSEGYEQGETNNKSLAEQFK